MRHRRLAISRVSGGSFKKKRPESTQTTTAMFRLPALAAAFVLATISDPLPQVAPQARAAPVAVLEWHDIEPAKAVYFDTTSATFAAQLNEIARRGFHVVSLAAVRDHLVIGKPLPSKALALTFDDNGEGIYRYAYPLLRSHRFPATLFVHTNYVGKTTSKAHNTWSQLNEMQRSGLIDIQSLTANHPPDLTVLSDADVLHEFTLSAHSIAVRGGRKPFAVVYPYDVYDTRVEHLAQDAGYTLAFTENHGLLGASPSLYELHRYSLAPQEDLFETALGDVGAR
jgi:peptidoglycan/xylan/chitin deacetylase (PgdA/CDA1 family)